MTIRTSTTGNRFAVVGAMAVLLAGAGVTGCSKRELVPPRIDLTPHRAIGLVTFTIENARGTLNEFATQRFAEEVLGGQGLLELLELGTAERVLREVNTDELGAEAARAIGERHNVAAVFVGHLVVSDVQPRVAVRDIGLPSAEATVTVAITARLLSAESGGTLWTRSGRASQVVGEVGMIGGEVHFSAEDPDEAYGRLVDELVYQLTEDFRPTYVRQ